MKKRFVIFTVLASLLLVCFAVLPVAAGVQDFTLVNQTGFTIYELYVSPSASDHWGEDILGDRVLADGHYIKITVNGSLEKYWDIMVKNGDGDKFTWKGFDLTEISKITLYYNWLTGKATAEYE